MWAPDPPPSRRPSVSMLLAILFASTTCYLLFLSTHAPNTQNSIQLLTQQDSSSPSSLRSSTLLAHDPEDDIIPNLRYSDDDPSQIRRRSDDEDDKKHKNKHDDDDDHKKSKDDDKNQSHSDKKKRDDEHEDDDADGDKKHKKSSDKKSPRKDDSDDEDGMSEKDSKWKKNKKRDEDDKKVEDDDHGDHNKDQNTSKPKQDDDDDDDDKDVKNKKSKKRNDDKKRKKKHDDDDEEPDDTDNKNKNKHEDDDEEHDKKDKKNKKHKNKDDADKNKKSKEKPTKEPPPDPHDQKGDTLNSETPTSSPTSSQSSSSSSSSPYRLLLFGDSITVGTGPTPRHPYSIRLQQLMDEKGIHVEMMNVGIDGNCVIHDPKPDRPSMVDRISEYLPIAPTNTSYDTSHQRRLLIELGSSSMGDEENPVKPGDYGKFDMVIILGGTNDLSHFYPPQDVLQGLLTIHERVRINGAITVAITIPERYNEIKTKPPYLYQRGQNTGEQLYARRMIINEGLQRYCQYHEPMKNGRTTDGKMPCLLVDLGYEMPYATDPNPTRAKKLWIDEVHPSAAGYDRMGEIIWDVISPHVSVL